MELLLNSLLFVVGTLLLIKGGDSFIHYSGKLGRKLGMKPVLIGLTIVSMGTSFPELAISVFGAIKGSAGVSIGNVVGSNIANVGIFLGFAGFIRILHVKKNIFTAETPLMIFTFILFYFFMQNNYFVSNIEGMILLIIFIAYIIFVFKKGMENKNDPLVEELLDETKSRKSKTKLSIYTSLGLGGLLVGSYIIVDSGIEIARFFNISETIIALSAMALGTSIPDVTASLMALKNGEKEVAYGGIIGSCIFNTLLIIGVSSFITPLSVEPRILQDAIFMIAFGVLMLPFAVSGFKLTQKKSIFILTLYLVWVISLFF